MQLPLASGNGSLAQLSLTAVHLKQPKHLRQVFELYVYWFSYLSEA